MTDPCCPPSLCDFRQERVRFWLHHIRQAWLNHYDPVEAARSVGAPREERHMGRGCVGAYGMQCEAEVIAILQALPERCSVQQIQVLHADPTDLMRKLCPFACER